MFTTGHFIFIGLSFALIVFFTCLLIKKRPKIDTVLSACLAFSFVSEIVKYFAKVEIMPVVEPIIENGAIVYKQTGAYAPYIEAEHFPFELCSYQILFMFLALVIKDKTWKKRIYALIYSTATTGGVMAIILSSGSNLFSTVIGFLLSVGIWRTFLYHSMLVVLGIYIGVSKECEFRFSDLKTTISILLVLDYLTFYINSMMATPYYKGDTLMGIGNVINYFSSYNNPLRIQMTTKLQWGIYLIIRFFLAFTFIIAVNLPIIRKEKNYK